jgi:hypothetical protein
MYYYGFFELKDSEQLCIPITIATQSHHIILVPIDFDWFFLFVSFFVQYLTLLRANQGCILSSISATESRRLFFSVRPYCAQTNIVRDKHLEKKQ